MDNTVLEKQNLEVSITVLNRAFIGLLLMLSQKFQVSSIQMKISIAHKVAPSLISWYKAAVDISKAIRTQAWQALIKMFVRFWCRRNQVFQMLIQLCFTVLKVNRMLWRRRLKMILMLNKNFQNHFCQKPSMCHLKRDCSKLSKAVMLVN